MIYCAVVIRYLKLLSVDGSIFFLHWSTFPFFISLAFTLMISALEEKNIEFETRFIVKSERRRQYKSRRRAIHIKAKKAVQSDESTKHQPNWMQKHLLISKQSVLSFSSFLFLPRFHCHGWFYLIIMKENSVFQYLFFFFENRKYSDDDEQQKKRKWRKIIAIWRRIEERGASKRQQNQNPNICICLAWKCV